MRIDRRTMLKGSTVAGAALGVPASQVVLAQESRLAIYDSRIPESAGFANSLKGEAGLIDIAHADANGWPMLRGDLPKAQVIEGLTGWSDWVAMRGELEARGWRFQRDDQAPAPISGKSHLFRWTLKIRT
ncbi:twin-arginine translocation signal domain-containing protein [Altererythrobacter sp.]|uniref:twin-arginine translocation signal domain-containing protein n=1 Tax=Altererythrobacter sp. TaxID=1872480 RepID=UPI003CFF3F2D